MRIGILGAPGAGKSKFAKKLSAGLREGSDLNVSIVDGYVEKLIKRTGFAYGQSAQPAQNFQVIFERWTLEQEAMHKGADVILSCGTIFEGILHTAIRSNNDIIKRVPEASIRARTLMQTLGIFTEISDYDLMFLLPFSDRVLKAKGKSYDTVVNEKLPEVLAGYFRPVTVLTGTDKQKVENAQEYIRIFTESQTQAAEAEQ